MLLIVGLGNVGLGYNGTRHNVGFSAVEAFASVNNMVWQDKTKFKANLAESTLGKQKVLLAKPATFYNDSGQTVLAIKNFYKLKNQDILVIHDDLALPLGTVRVRNAGSDAGNNGIKSIIAAIGSDFAR